MIYLYLLEHMYNLFLMSAYALGGVTLYLYTRYPLFHNIPFPLMTSGIPMLAAIFGIILFQYPLCALLLFIIMQGLHYAHPMIILNRHNTLYVLHACLCAALPLCLLWIDGARLQEKKMLLQKNKHSVEGLIIEKREHKKNALLSLALTHIDSQPVEGVLNFFVYSMPRGKVGSYVQIRNVQLMPEKTKNTMDAYLKRDHVLGTCFCPFIKVYTTPKTTIYSLWIAWWYTWRASLYERLRQILSPRTFSLFSSLFLGNKNTDEYMQSRVYFTRWGLTHYLARSGLHISLLISLWSAVMRILPLAHSVRAFLLGFILFVYNELSWSSISFNRALWLCFLSLASLLSCANTAPLFGFFQLTFLILLTHPWQAACLDFQLSFFLTMILLLLSYHKRRLFLLSSCIVKKK